jgi:hypothetical protein
MIPKKQTLVVQLFDRLYRINPLYYGSRPTISINSAIHHDRYGRSHSQVLDKHFFGRHPYWRGSRSCKELQSSPLCQDM